MEERSHGLLRAAAMGAHDTQERRMRDDTVEGVLPEMKLRLAALVDARDAGEWPEERR